jgi:sulfite reductase alpha subunit-like flavoprotein
MNKAQERFEAKRNEALTSLLGDAPADARAAAAAVLEKELLGVVNAWTEAWVKALTDSGRYQRDVW